MLFRNPKNLKPCGLFSLGHFLLLAITFFCIIVALKYTKNKSKEQIKNIIRNSTCLLWILEIVKIFYSIKIYGFLAINKYVPLYFCSLILYAGIFSGFCNNVLKKVGDTFLATGGIVAGLVFLICPLTSLTTYPTFHFISIQSFILHGTMLYLGLLVLISNYVTLEKTDFKYYAILIISISIIAFVINLIFDSNLMFISQNYPGTFIEIIYKLSGKMFPIVMILGQVYLPFYLIYGLYSIVNKKKVNHSQPTI